MDILLIALIIVAMVVPIIMGLLLGSMRGMRRSIIRIILVALSIVLAFCLKGVITEQIMNVEIDGKPLGEAIASMLFQGYDIPAETVTNLVSLLVVAVVFLASLMLLLFVTWAIIFPICKLFLRNRKPKDADGSGGKKHKKHNGLSRLIGSALGLVQGVAVAVVCVTVLNGLFFNISNVAATMNEMQQSEATAESTENGGSEDEKYAQFLDSIVKYNDSGIRKFIGKMGGDKLFDGIVTIETEDGKKLTLTGQIDALRGLVNMGKELSSIQNLEMSGGLSSDTADELANILNKLDEINSSLTDESKDTINTLVQTVASQMLPDMNIDFSSLDFKTISFANEGQVITELSGYKETDFSTLTEEDAKQKATEIVGIVMQSDVILPLLGSNPDFTIGLDKDGKAYSTAKSIIEELEQNPESDATKIDLLKNFFGLNDQTSGGNGGTTTPEQPVEPAPEQPSEPDTPEVSE